MFPKLHFTDCSRTNFPY